MENAVQHLAKSHMTRRRLMVGAAAVAAGARLGAPPASGQGSSTPHAIKVGDIEITVFSDGVFTQPLSVMLPSRPESEVEALYKQHQSVFAGLEAQVNVTLIRSGSQLILVDAGGGPDFLPTLGRLNDRLDAAGVKLEAIIKVVFTHAHGDHFWGVIDPLGGGTLFEKAQHIMTGAERDFWLRPDVEGLVGEPFRSMAAGTHRHLKSIADRIQVASPGQEIAPGIALVDTAGHSPGHVSVHVRSGGEQLLIGGDALIQSVISFAAPDWRWGPDMDADRAITTRKFLLDRLSGEKIALLGYHLPWPGIGRAERRGTAYRFVPA